MKTSIKIQSLQGEWEEGLKAVEEALWVTPRTIHRYMCLSYTYILRWKCTFCLFVGRHLAQHKLVFKSKMKRDVDGDMIRFQVHT